METVTLTELREILKGLNRNDTARRLKIARTSLAKVISGKRLPSKPMLKALGLRPVITIYEVISCPSPKFRFSANVGCK
jgi:hypothetical protein